MAVSQSKTWNFLVFEESMNPQFFQILKSSMFQVAISPLHVCHVYYEDDPAVISGDHFVGEVKKAHYHLVVHSNEKKSYNQMLELARRFAKDPEHPVRPERTGDIGASLRYLIHKGDVSKTQYDYNDITVYNGWDIEPYFGSGDDINDKFWRAIKHLIRVENILEYWQLLDYLDEHLDEAFDQLDVCDLDRFVRKHTILVNSALRSRKGMIREVMIDNKNDEFRERVCQLLERERQ